MGGGPGVKKKACINRVCLNADQPPSPALRPADCKPGGPPSFGLPDALTRGPLLPLHKARVTARVARDQLVQVKLELLLSRRTGPTATGELLLPPPERAERFSRSGRVPV